jgi:hypothetical protein
MGDWQDVLWKLAPVFTSFGVLIAGASLAHRARHREWIADNQKEEYRKLLSALNRLNLALIDKHTQRNSSQDPQALIGALSEAINTSLFITEFLKKSQVLRDILAASKKLEQGGKFEDYHEEYWRAIKQIMNAATRIKM